MFRQSSARVWDVASGKEIAHLAHDMIYGLSFSPDGNTLATAGWDKRVRFWTPDTAKVRREFEVSDPKSPGGDMRLYAVCYSPTGDLIATADMNNSVRIWDAGDLSLKATLQHRYGFTFGSIAFSPDGLLVGRRAQERRRAHMGPAIRPIGLGPRPA